MAEQVTEADKSQRRIAGLANHESPLPLRIHRGKPGGTVAAGSRIPRLSLPLVLLTLAIAIGLIMQRQRQVETDRESVSEPAGSVAPKPSGFALGMLEPNGRVVEVAAPEGGGNSRIREIRVEEGQYVHSGDVLAVLDNEDRLKREIESFERQLGLARARLDQALQLASTGREEARAAVRISQINRDRAERDKTKIARLYRSKAASLEENDNALQDAEIAALSLEANVARLTRYAAGEGRDAVDVAVSRMEIEVREAEIAEARTRLEQAYVRAPISGRVLKIHLRAGEYVGQRAILDMGDTERMMARAEVYESIVRHLSPGKRVILRSAALDEPLQGTLESISSMVRRQSIVDALPAANTDARVVEAMIVLDADSSRTAARFVGLQVRAEFLP